MHTMKLLRACGVCGVLLAASGCPDSRGGAAGRIERGMERGGDATRRGLEKAGDATGRALGTAVDKTGEGVGTAVEKTGKGLKKAGESLEGR